LAAVSSGEVCSFLPLAVAAQIQSEMGEIPQDKFTDVELTEASG